MTSDDPKPGSSSSDAAEAPQATEFRSVAALADLADGAMLGVDVDGHPLAVVRVGDDVHVIDGECTHAGAPLCEGEIEDGEIVCPWHAGRFEICSGRATGRPAALDVRHYRSRVVDGHIEVALD